MRIARTLIMVLSIAFSCSIGLAAEGFSLDIERALQGLSIDGSSSVPGWNGGTGRIQHHLREAQLASQMGGLVGRQDSLAIGVGLRLGKGKSGLVGALFSGGVPIQTIRLEEMPWPWLDEQEAETNRELEDFVAAEIAARLGPSTDR